MMKKKKPSGKAETPARKPAGGESPAGETIDSLEDLRHYSAVSRTIREVNQMIIREDDRDRLIGRAVTILTSTLGYYNAWIALLDGSGRVTAVADAGFDGGFKTLRERLERGDYPGCLRRALEREGVQVIEDPLQDCPECPVSGEYGGRAGLAARLTFEGRDYGVLAASVPGRYARREEEHGLFQELAGDLAFALRKIELAEEHRRQEEALRASEAQYRFLTEQMNDIVWTADLEMRSTYISPSIEKVLGFTPAERVKQPLEEQMPPATLRLAGDKLAEELARDGERDPDRTLTLDLDYYHKDGSIRVLETSLSFIRDEKGKPIGIHGLSRDVTDRKRAEEELRERERRLDLFFSQSLHGFFICMLDEPIEWHDGVDKEKELDYVLEHQRMTLVNQAMLDQYGARREDFVGITVGELFRHDLAHARRIWRGLFDRGRWHVETSERKMDGTPVVIDGDYICLYDDQGRITGHFGVQADITESKRAEEELRESEARFRAVFDRAKDGIFIETPDGEILDVNRAVTEMLGYSREELLKMRVGDLVPPDIAAQLPPTIRPETVADGAYVETEEVARDGTRIPVEVGNTLVEIGGEKRVIAIIRDISERKRAEDALAEEEIRRRILIEQSRDGIVILDQDGGVREANRRFAEMLGYPPEEVCGLHVWDWDREFLRDKLLEMIRTVDEEGDFFQTRHRRKDGTYYDVEISTNGAVIGGRKLVFCVCRDITDRKRAEEALKRSEARFKNILLYAPLAIQGYRPDGTVVYWNREAERVYGYTAGEAVGRNLGDLIIPDEIRPMYEESLSGCAALEKSGEFMPAGEVSLRRKDGSRVSVHSIHTAVCVEGEEPMLFCLDLDLSERKRMEAERLKMERKLQQTQKLESLGVLAGGIAHDFNNILMVILGNAELALREMGSLSPARESVTEISAASRQAAELCKQMLAYAGRASFVREPLDLATLIKETAHLIKVSISRGVVLQYELAPGRVEGDPAQLRQVVMNLVINSSEAIGERSGVVTIATGKVFLDEAEVRRRDPSGDLRAGEYVSLRVADNGRGMDEETRNRVFEPFFTTKFTGRGLGLAAVLGIVQGHGGTISVESEPEVGTTFRVFLPALGAEQAARPPAAEKREAPGWTGTGTVLVAEDEDRVRTLAARILEGMGFTVLSSADGREAVEVYREHGKEIDLVILDLTMPHLDGAGALEQILAIDPEARVILASGFSEEELEKRFRRSGLAGILQKPYDLESFTAAVRRALAG